MGCYKSCWSLQHHLEFGLDNQIHACCECFLDSGNKTRGMVAIARIGDDRFPAAAIAAGRALTHAKIANDTEEDCRECVHLRSAQWDTPKYLAIGLTLNVWSHCNLACKYCYTSVPGFRYSKVTYSLPAVVREMLEGDHLDPAGIVTWGGGDISALPEFNETSHLFIEYGVTQNFKTSAFKFLSGVSRAIAEKKGVVEVSVDAGTRETYAAYKGRDAWETVVANILRYREYGPLNLKYITDFCNVGEADIDGFLRLVARVDPSDVTITAESNSAWANTFAPQTISGVARLLYLLRQTGVSVHPRHDHEGALLFPHIWERIKADMERMAT